MKKINTLIALTFISLTSAQVVAAPPVEDAPPAQLQKDNVPNSTENGNYLEPQPADGHDTKSGDKHHKKDGKHKPKGKNVTEEPKDGGAAVTPK